MRNLVALFALPLVLVVGLALGGPTAADPPTPPGTKPAPAGQQHRAEQAAATLDRVQDLVSGRAAHRHGDSDHRDLTLALRDLRLQAGDLPEAEKQVAERYFLRPGTRSDPYIPAALPLRKCSTAICIHWRESGAHAPEGPHLDGDQATVPPYVDLVLGTVQQIHDDYVAAGYRAPKSDGRRGGSTGKVDIYIGDIGADDGLYGFCGTDDPQAALDPPPSWDVWAYCVLDDDYAARQYPTNTPTENMQVTAAHEYFHAVQYAYDFAEDGWIIESTATWVEDEMFDAVDDNRYYLARSPLRQPYRSLDLYGGRGFHYGTWIWWRYLTEKFTTRTGKLPKLVLDVWERLDGSAGGPDEYSTRGLSTVLAERSTSLGAELQRFHAANREPAAHYEEGGSYGASPTTLTLNYDAAEEKSADFRPAHLSSVALRLNPAGLVETGWMLELVLDAPAPDRGGAFVIVEHRTDGSSSTSLVPLDSTGGGVATVPFSSPDVAHVDVLLVNTSSRFACWQGRPYSCQGQPRDDGRLSQITGRAFRA